MDETWRAAWVAALDDLEGTLADTETLLRGGLGEVGPEDAAQAAGPAGPTEPAGATPWTPPVMPCPLPADLLHRAESLLARQRLLVAETTATVGGLRQQAGLVDRIASRSGLSTGQRPVYVDLTA